MVNNLGIYWYIPIIDIPLWTKHLGNIEMNGIESNRLMWKYVGIYQVKGQKIFGAVFDSRNDTNQVTEHWASQPRHKHQRYCWVRCDELLYGIITGLTWPVWDTKRGEPMGFPFGKSSTNGLEFRGFSWIFVDFRWCSLILVDFPHRCLQVYPFE